MSEIVQIPEPEPRRAVALVFQIDISAEAAHCARGGGGCRPISNYFRSTRRWSTVNTAQRNDTQKAHNTNNVP